MARISAAAGPELRSAIFRKYADVTSFNLTGNSNRPSRFNPSASRYMALSFVELCPQCEGCVDEIAGSPEEVPSFVGFPAASDKTNYQTSDRQGTSVLFIASSAVSKCRSA